MKNTENEMQQNSSPNKEITSIIINLIEEYLGSHQMFHCSVHKTINNTLLPFITLFQYNLKCKGARVLKRVAKQNFELSNLKPVKFGTGF